jgi:hypothetical protein
VQANVRCGPWLAVAFVLLASCAKHSARLPTTLFPPPSAAGSGAAPSAVVRVPRTEANRIVPQKPRLTRAAIRPGKPENPSVGTIIVDVALKPVDGASRIDLRRAVLDALNRIVQNDLLFAYPDRLHAGSRGEARLTARRDVNGELKAELAARGVPLSESASIVTMLTADLTSPRNALVITPENSAKNSSEYQRDWRIDARAPGKQRLDLTVALRATIPEAGDVQSQPLVFSHWLAVDAGSQLLRTYWPVLAGSVAALAAVLGWTLWRRRRSLIPTGR